MCQIFSFHGNCTVRNGKRQKTSSAYLCICFVYTSKPTNHTRLFLSLFFLFLFLILFIFFILSPRLFLHSFLSLSFAFNLTLSLYLSVSVASRHRADMLTCASNTWASLLIRLRSVLREIPSTYAHSQIHTRTHTHIQTHHMHTHKLADCKAPKVWS